VAVISTAMARRYWPNDDPIGNIMQTEPGGRILQIVGVVADAPIVKIGELPEPYFYTSWWQDPSNEHTLLVETAGNPTEFAPTLRVALKRMDPRLERVSVTSIEELVRVRTNVHQSGAQLVASLGVVGLLLMAAGLYGVLSYGVALRRREIGIRIALGARAAQAAGLVLRQGLGLAAAGIVLGLPLAAAAGFALRAELFGVAPWDPASYLVGVSVLLVVSLAASWIPSRRASCVDPMTVLRDE
jgi:predicted lysophospholipase L1 biosynthesis ABC-type transport system permease subunit